MQAHLSSPVFFDDAISKPASRTLEGKIKIIQSVPFSFLSSYLITYTHSSFSNLFVGEESSSFYDSPTYVQIPFSFARESIQAGGRQTFYHLCTHTQYDNE